MKYCLGEFRCNALQSMRHAYNAHDDDVHVYLWWVSILYNYSFRYKYMDLCVGIHRAA